MAIVKAEILSKCLMRTVPIYAIIPSDKQFAEDLPKEQNAKFKTLYLFHGLIGNEMDWLAKTRIERWAMDKNLAVIMPAGENRFYVDQQIPGQHFGEFVGSELVTITRNLFPLSWKREDTFIGGLSMGGYGALVNGLKYHQTFSHIAALSSALIINKIEQAVSGTDNIFESKEYFEMVFGDLSKLKGSDKDYYELFLRLVKNKEDIPKIYMAIGKQDDLYEVNREYYQFLQTHNACVHYVEEPGNHDWDFWDNHIRQVLDWLPLGDAKEGIGSGNISTK